MGNYRLIIVLLISIFFRLGSTLQAQPLIINCSDSLLQIKSNKEIFSTSLYSDSLTSVFYLIIKSQVDNHFHATHTETVQVLSGKARMLLGDEWITIKKGSILVIPANTKHAVTVVGKNPLKVISIQAPYYDGTDRVVLQ